MKSKKIKYAIWAIIAVAAVALCIVAYNIFRTRKITDFCDDDLASIESISITNGNNGNMVHVPSEEYDDVMKFLTGLSFSRVIVWEKRTGWSYCISINQKNNKAVSIVFQGERCDVNGKCYKLTGYDCELFVEGLFLKLYEE